ncbi:hypothetical protein M8J77_018173 [Diaphorina citri]|nr:hypothetical protein M8J77_018173 [Diaphorina citri]
MERLKGLINAGVRETQEGVYMRDVETDMGCQNYMELKRLAQARNEWRRRTKMLLPTNRQIILSTSLLHFRDRNFKEGGCKFTRPVLFRQCRFFLWQRQAFVMPDLTTEGVQLIQSLRNTVACVNQMDDVKENF